MTAEERIEAALAALPNATPGQWERGDDVTVWHGLILTKKEGQQFTLATCNQHYPEDADANSQLIAAAPDLAVEVLRLRAELAEVQAESELDKDIIRVLQEAGIGETRRANKAEAELAELKRWRDPVTDPPKESGNYNCINESVTKAYYDEDDESWFDDGLLIRPTGWMPLPEVPHA